MESEQKPYLIALETTGENLVVTYSKTKSGYHTKQFSRSDLVACLRFFLGKVEAFVNSPCRIVVLGDEKLSSKDQALLNSWYDSLHRMGLERLYGKDGARCLMRKE